MDGGVGHGDSGHGGHGGHGESGWGGHHDHHRHHGGSGGNPGGSLDLGGSAGQGPARGDRRRGDGAVAVVLAVVGVVLLALMLYVGSH